MLILYSYVVDHVHVANLSAAVTAVLSFFSYCNICRFAFVEVVHADRSIAKHVHVKVKWLKLHGDVTGGLAVAR